MAAEAMVVAMAEMVKAEVVKAVVAEAAARARAAEAEAGAIAAQVGVPHAKNLGFTFPVCVATQAPSNASVIVSGHPGVRQGVRVSGTYRAPAVLGCHRPVVAAGRVGNGKKYLVFSRGPLGGRSPMPISSLCTQT